MPRVGGVAPRSRQFSEGKSEALSSIRDRAREVPAEADHHGICVTADEIAHVRADHSATPSNTCGIRTRVYSPPRASCVTIAINASLSQRSGPRDLNSPPVQITARKHLQAHPRIPWH